MSRKQARAPKRKRHRCKKAKLSVILPSQPKPDSVQLPSPPLPELLQLPNEFEESKDDSTEESNDDSSSDDDVVDKYIKPTERDMESDEAQWALYERWCHYYRKSRTPGEMQRRFSNFKKGANFTFELNRKHGSVFVMCRREDEMAQERRQRTNIPLGWDIT